MKTNLHTLIPCLTCIALPFVGQAETKFTDTFDVNKADLMSVGTNRYFVLVPGFQHVLERKEGGKKTVLTITVLNETKVVDGVETRVVEERETADGQVVEISRNYFAISKRPTDVFYFGEDVDIYKGGKVTSHEGAWLSGAAGDPVWPHHARHTAAGRTVSAGSGAQSRDGSGGDRERERNGHHRSGEI